MSKTKLTEPLTVEKKASLIRNVIDEIQYKASIQPKI